MRLIVATDPNGGIGKNGKLPWHYKEDMRWFKGITYNEHLVMGRKTFDDVGPLENRTIHVVTSQQGKAIVDNETNSMVLIGSNILGFHDYYDDLKNIIIVGGSSIYEMALPHVKEMFITEIPKVYECDTFFKFGGSWDKLLLWESNGLKCYRYIRK